MDEYARKGQVLAGKKSIGKNEYVHVRYNIKAQQGPKNQMFIIIEGKYADAKYYRLEKATVKFSKKENGKTVYSTKNFKAYKEETMSGGYTYSIYYSPKNGYKPYYATVTYRNK